MLFLLTLVGVHWFWCLLGSLIPAVLVYGWSFAWFQREYPSLAEKDRKEDRKFALFVALLTFFVPLCTVIPILMGKNEHGVKF